MSRARLLLADALVAGLVGGVAVGFLEAVALGGPVGVVAVCLALHAFVGLLVGAAMALPEAAVERWALRPVPAALLRAAPAIVVLVPLAGTLFQGAMAATLPGASLAHWWLPSAGTVGLAVAIYAAERMGVLEGRRRRAATAAGLLGFLTVVEWGNRSLYRTEYPDLHLFLVLVAVAAAAVIVRVVAGPSAAFPRRAGFRASLAALVAAAAVLVALTGLATPEDRWVVANEGTHTRHLTRAARAVFDLDGDGFSSILGGGDCDDGDPRVNPAAREIPNNGIDEDCDGEDLQVVAEREAGRAELEAWLAGAEARELIARTRDMNLVVLSIDTMRADLLTPTAANRAAYPRLFELLDGARVFDRAFSPAAGTDVAMGTFVTGRLNPFQPLEATLFEALQATGRVTHGVIPSEVLRYAGETLLTRGLDRHTVVVNDGEVRDVGSYTTSVQTTDAGIAFLDRLARRHADRAFALWLHYFDLHEHAQIRNSDRRLREVAERAELGDAAGKYRALGRLVDREIGRLLDDLAERGVADRTVIVLFSDHGESLGEDPRLPEKHGLYVYNPLVHVPLAVKVPGVAPARLPAPVTLLDLAPTVAALLGAELPGDLEGLPLLPHLVDAAPEALRRLRRAIVLNESDQWGLIFWPYKLMVRPAENLFELYDLEADLAERRNLAVRLPHVVRELKGIYAGFPEVHLDRTRAGRRWRERQARPPASR